MSKKSDHRLLDQKIEEDIPPYIPAGYDPHKLPQFAQLFYVSDVAEEDKISFWDNYLHRYLTDPSFRRSQQGLYIYRVNGRFIGVYPHTKTNELRGHHIVPITIEVTDHPQEYYLM